MAFRISDMTVLRANDLTKFKSKMCDAIKVHCGRVAHIAQDLGVGETSVKRWLREFPDLHKVAVAARTKRS